MGWKCECLQGSQWRGLVIWGLGLVTGGEFGILVGVEGEREGEGGWWRKWLSPFFLWARWACQA